MKGNELSKQDGSRLTVRHVAVVVTGILVCFGPATLVFNTWSILVVPVCDGLGVSTGSFTLYVSAIFLASAAVSPFAGNLMQRFDLRIVITTACALCAAGIFLCSFYTQVWQFYFSGILQGAGVVVLVALTAPTLINRWFRSHTGLLIGICVAMMGVGAAVWNMLGGFLLSEYDWRMCYRVFGAAAALVSMPATLLFIRSYPEEVGLVAYGKAKEGDSDEPLMERGIPAARAFTMPAFFLVMITIGLNNGVAQMGNYLATYFYHLSDIGILLLPAAEVVLMASVVTACLQVSQACAKVVLGQIADHSLRAALVVFCSCGLLGVLCCWQGPAFDPNFVYAGSALFGVLFGATNVLGPTITRYLFGPRDYTVIYSRISIIINLVPALFIPLYAFLADMGWDVLFAFAFLVVATIFACAMMLMRFAKKMQMQQ